MSDDSATRTIVKTAATTLIALGTAAAIYGIMTTDFSEFSFGNSSGSEKKKKKSEESTEENIYIYYGSQTGTAETFAHEIQSGCKKILGEKAKVLDLEDWEEDEFCENKIVIFCVATYGEGDPTDNAIDFHDWLIAEEDEEKLKGQSFCVFALGNTQYLIFNAMGKICDHHLERIGGTRFFERGEGNDDQDIEVRAEPWTGAPTRSLILLDPVRRSGEWCPKPCGCSREVAWKDEFMSQHHEAAIRRETPPTENWSRWPRYDAARKNHFPWGHRRDGYTTNWPASQGPPARAEIEADKETRTKNPHKKEEPGPIRTLVLPPGPRERYLSCSNIKGPVPLDYPTPDHLQPQPNTENPQSICSFFRDKADFDAWLPGLWPALAGALVAKGLRDASKVLSDKTSSMEVPVFPLDLQIKEDRSALPLDPMVKNGGNDTLSKALFTASKAKVIAKRELKQQADYDQGNSCIHVDLKVDPNQLRYKTADNLDITQENPQELVQFWAKVLKVDDKLDHFVGFTKSEDCDELTAKKPFPTPTQMSWVLKQCCDLQFLPSRSVLRTLSTYIPNEDRKKALFKLFEDGQFHGQLQKLKMTFREAWLCFYSDVEIPVSDFLQIVARPKARAMTICSSNLEDKTTVSLCIAMLKEKSDPLPFDEWRRMGIMSNGNSTNDNNNRNYAGVCSTWACTFGLQPGNTVLVTNHASSLRLPRAANCPVIMIAAGSGIAPFRAFWRELAYLYAKDGQKRTAVLFFGCRHPDKDFLYKDEIQEMQDSGILTEVVTAFSRETNKKVYVQDRLRERKDDIKKWASNKGYFIICGSTAMGNSVEEVVGSVCDVKQLRNEKRFVEELFG
eukprot:gene429-126_t